VTDWTSPIELPEAKLGGVEIKHIHAKEFDIVSMREALLTGKPPQRITLDEPIRIHQLLQDGHLWIADLPIEIRQHREAIRNMFPRGRVLVGGLGLGIAARLLAAMPSVTTVDVVEISPEIAKLCNPHHPKVNVIVEDFRAFIARQPEWIWSSAFVDLWTGTSEGNWWVEVFPLRRLIARKFGKWNGDGVFYWAEDIMLGQIGHVLMSSSQPHWNYKAELKRPMSLQRARWFLRNIGTPLWERRYGSIYPEEK